MLRKIVFLLAFVGAVAANAQNPLLTSSNTVIRTATYGGGVQSLSGLPLGTSDDSSTSEIVLKTKTVGTITLGGTSAVSVPGGVVVNSGTMTLTGTQITATPQSLTTGTTSYTAGLSRFDFLVISGTTQWLTTTGTVTYTAGQGYGASVFPNTYPAMSLIVTPTGQTLVNAIR